MLAFRRIRTLKCLQPVGRRGLTYSRTSLGPFPGAPLPFDELTESSEEEQKQGKSKEKKSSYSKYHSVFIKCVETAGIMVASLSMLGLAGLIYHRGYRNHALSKMENAFAEGDPAFELAMHSRSSMAGQDIEVGWVTREHQKLLEDVIAGKIVGRYFLMIGEKGTGKTSMILEAMKKTNALGCTFLEAHADPEIFRIRLGKALNFEFHEDYLGSLFSIRGPRDTIALLDIERAFNSLEKVAVRYVKKHKRPLILIINSAHLIRDDQEGRNLVELLQQKAEALSGAGLVTMVFNSDDYWLYERLKKLGTRLEVLTINDFSRQQSIQALKSARMRFIGELVSNEKANEVYNLIGGRPQHLAAVASQLDLISACHKLIDKEKTWFLNQCGLLGEDMDDDVMESGKFSTSAMFLMKALVELDKERLKAKSQDDLLADDHHIPRIPLWRARQIMTRPDYIQQYDNLNIFTIDSLSRVKADSVVMMNAFHEIASLPGFDELLDETADRVAAIESLGRTRELVAKDLVLGGRYKISQDRRSTFFDLEQPDEETDEEDEASSDHYKLDHTDETFWWKKRAEKYKKKKEALPEQN